MCYATFCRSTIYPFLLERGQFGRPAVFCCQATYAQFVMLHQHRPVPRVHLAKLRAVFQAVGVLGASLHSALPACYIIRLAHTGPLQQRWAK
jgi:hypothetical protein